MSSQRKSWFTGRSRSKRLSTRTPRSRSKSRCGIRWARASFAAFSWSCRSKIRFLYVSPLYLRAQSGQLPELKRVIAAYGDRVVMEETLPAALAALFKESASVAALAPPAGLSAAAPADERAREALTRYDRAIDRLKAGDWAGFGAELDALRPLLEELGRH